MMPLYQISSQYQSLFSALVDAEELTHDELKELENYQEKIEDKAISIAYLIKNLEAEHSGVDIAIKDMSKRKKQLDNKIDYLMGYLKINMEKCAISEISTSPHFKIKIKSCPLSVNVIDEEKIPNEYKKVKETISIDKIKLKEDLKDGLFIEGAELQQNSRLEIK